ncbi:MAG: BMP family ABC transporter substrate-binding protein [Oscillospiraceae bacterium]|nr:BMP family ABC transporter substrate-binding protein [Oscillospiraceae bacterium]
MKKILALVLSLAMITVLLAGCGGTKPAESGTESTAPDASSEALPGAGMKIALVCDKVGTQVFLLQMVNGLKETAAKYGFEYTVAECADSAAYEDNMRALVAEDYNLIIGGGWQAGDAINKVATEFPDACDYALIDSEVEAANVKCISYREQEGAYLIGIIAALVTDGDSHVYGAVHVNEGPGSWKWRYGYMEGVLSQDPDATFVFNYVGSYSDPAKAKELAIQQYEQGCVFINSAAAGGDSGTFEAAKEKGFYTSGQDVDLTDPANPYIVTSQIKDTYATMQKLIDLYFSGWNTDDEIWGVKEGTIGAVYVTHDSQNPMSDRLSAEDIAIAKQAADDISSGKLDFTTIPTEEEYMASKGQ